MHSSRLECMSLTYDRMACAYIHVADNLHE